MPVAVGDQSLKQVVRGSGPQVPTVRAASFCWMASRTSNFTFIPLVAEVDEFHLPRLHTGQSARSNAGDLRLAQTLPQVQGGKVRVLLRWPDGAATPPSLRAGQSVDVQLQLADPRPALLLPDGPGVQAQLYVRQGRELQRRRVQLGRRAAGQVEVLSGLQAGEEVLISSPPTDAERFSLP